MEIEKKRETSWKIHLGNKKKYIELSSIEIGGEVKTIRVSLKDKNNNYGNVEMNKDRFFNFLSLISAFKDVVIGNYQANNREFMDNINAELDSSSNSKNEYHQDNGIETNKKRKFDDQEEDTENTEWDLW